MAWQMVGASAAPARSDGHHVSWRRYTQGEQSHVVGAAGRQVGEDLSAQPVQRFVDESEGVPEQPVQARVEVAARCLDEPVRVQQQGGAGLQGMRGVRSVRVADGSGAEEQPW